MTGLVDVRREGTLAVLELRREEKLNALSTALERALLDAVASGPVVESACVVLHGRGAAFSAGADLHEPLDKSPAGILAYYRDTGNVFEQVASLTQPTVAAVHGWCLGGGFELALATDFRVADETAVFGMPEVELGILPGSGGTYRLVRLLGSARAKELLLLRPRIDADEALAYGLVTEIAPAGHSLERAIALAARLAGLPRKAAAAAKLALDRA